MKTIVPIKGIETRIFRRGRGRWSIEVSYNHQYFDLGWEGPKEETVWIDKMFHTMINTYTTDVINYYFERNKSGKKS